MIVYMYLKNVQLNSGHRNWYIITVNYVLKSSERKLNHKKNGIIYSNHQIYICILE